MEKQFNFFNQFTPQQIKNQYRSNYSGLVKMRDKALLTGKKVNGYTLDQLNNMVAKYKELSK